MRAGRRNFAKTIGLVAGAAALPSLGWGLGTASQINLAQIVYPGGNWQPRPTALRRLAWEIHKRTAIDTVLEPRSIKPTLHALSSNPLVFLAGDRPFPAWSSSSTNAMRRFLKLGGTLIIDPAEVSGVNATGFEESVDQLLEAVVPKVRLEPIAADHVLYRSFYQINRPLGRVEGPPHLWAHEMTGRLSIIRTRHDLGGAWARDNLGSWEYEVSPGGQRQREYAFRLGINLVFYGLCQDYKDELSHRRFGDPMVKD